MTPTIGHCERRKVRGNPHLKSGKGDFMNYYVYILTNAHKTVLYTGVTNDLLRRVYEHKNHLDPKSCTSQYNVEYLVYYEVTTNPEAAIAREKQIKAWSRKKKDKLITDKNPEWIDLYSTLI